MKIKIEMDEQAEEEVIIRCRGMTEQIAAIQRAVSEAHQVGCQHYISRN